MPVTDIRLFFDFVDPLCWLVERALTALEAAGAPPVQRVGCELRPPPAALTRVADPFWADRLAAAARADPDVTLRPGAVVPWSRKAHELHLHAAAHDAAQAVRRRIYEAHFERGRDIGRVDELVRVAEAAGLDATEAKAALDVDKHLADVLAARRSALEAGFTDLPALVVAGKVVQGFHNLSDLSTLLDGPPRGGR